MRSDLGLDESLLTVLPLPLSRHPAEDKKCAEEEDSGESAS